MHHSRSTEAQQCAHAQPSPHIAGFATRRDCVRPVWDVHHLSNCASAWSRSRDSHERMRPTSVLVWLSVHAHRIMKASELCHGSSRATLL